MPRDEQSVAGDRLGKPTKGVLDFCERIVAVEMVGLDPRDGGLPGAKLEEVRPILTSLDHKQRAAGLKGTEEVVEIGSCDMENAWATTSSVPLAPRPPARPPEPAPMGVAPQTTVGSRPA